MCVGARWTYAWYVDTLLLMTSLYPHLLDHSIVLNLDVLHHLGVAFSKHIVQIYTYNPTGELRQHLEVSPLPWKLCSPLAMAGYR
jgi:hypothetical protein